MRGTSEAARSSRWPFTLALAHLAACHGAGGSRPNVPTGAPPTPVVFVASLPPAPAPPPSPTTAAELSAEASDTSAADAEAGPLLLNDPEPSRPLPKAPYFVEVRGDAVDIVTVTGCGKSQVPSAVFSSYNEPQLILCADGPPDTGPNLTLGSPSAHRTGRFESGHSEFVFDGEYYETRTQLTVVITKYGLVGKTVEGSYITEVHSLNGTAARTFFGRFRVLREPDGNVQF